MPWIKDAIAPGKINLYLDITGRRADGYHTLDTVMQTVDMADLVQAQMLSEIAAVRMFNEDQSPLPAAAELGPALNMSIELTWFSKTGVWQTADEVSQNTCYKAARLFWMHAVGEEGMAAGPKQRLLVRIHKRIPMEAGLGGGSADAAALLDLLWQVYGKPFPYSELEDIAHATGADVPFCLKGGTRHCTGIGEELAYLPSLPAWELLIVKPATGSNTKEAFRTYDEWLASDDLAKRLHGPVDSGAFRTKLTEIAFNAKVNLRQADEVIDLSELQGYGGNVFTSLVEEQMPQLRKLLAGLNDLYPQALTSLSGSGTACFVLFGARDAGIDLKALHVFLDAILGQGEYKIYRTRLKKGRFGTES